MFFKRKKKEFNCEYYTEEEYQFIEDHIKGHFGDYENVFHELVSPDIHVDIAVIEPTEERNYYTLMTMGMGAHRMNVPDELADADLERAEIMINLPPEWEIGNEDEKWYWPIRWLKIIARLPIEHDTWVGWGHTIPSSDKIADTDFTCMLLISPTTVEEDAWECGMPDGSVVNFYQMVPLYENEVEFKLDNDAEPLLERMDDYMLEVLDVGRENTCTDVGIEKNPYDLKERTDQFWSWFSENEKKLSDIASRRSSLDTEGIVEFISEGTSLISDDLYFNIGGDHEFTFSVNHDGDLFHILPYVVSRMPSEYNGKWTFHPYMRGTAGESHALKMHDIAMDADTTMVFMHPDHDARKSDITFFNEALSEADEDELLFVFTTLMDNTIGEWLTFNFIGDVEMGKIDGMFPLSELERRIIDEFSIDMSEGTAVYTVYSHEPEDVAIPRFDVHTGVTCIPELIADYYDGSVSKHRDLMDLGARAISIFYAHDPEKDNESVLEERYMIADLIESKIGRRGSGTESAVVTGGAVGVTLSYIDMLVYDQKEFQKSICDILDEVPHVFFISDLCPTDEIEHHVSADADIAGEMQNLHKGDLHDLIANVIAPMSKDERGFELSGIYGRALNNLNREEEALEVLMDIRGQGEEDGVWNFRVGYSLYYLGREPEAYPYFRRAYDLGDHDEDTLYMLERSRMYTMTDEELFNERRSVWTPKDEPFEDFDTSVIWDEDENDHQDEPPSDKTISDIEKEFGYRLPESYKQLMGSHNGGILLLDEFVPEHDRYGEDHIIINGMFSLGSGPLSVCGVCEQNSTDKGIGIPIADSPFSDDDMIYLDYRFCGKEGEPEVAYVSDGKVKFLADDFESFIRGLYSETTDHLDEME